MMPKSATSEFGPIRDIRDPLNRSPHQRGRAARSILASDHIINRSQIPGEMPPPPPVESAPALGSGRSCLLAAYGECITNLPARTQKVSETPVRVHGAVFLARPNAPARLLPMTALASHQCVG